VRAGGRLCAQNFYPSVPFKTPLERGRRVLFHNDFRGLFPFEYSATCLMAGIGLLCLVGSARLGLSRYAKAVWVTTTWLQILVGAITATCYLAQGQDRMAGMVTVFYLPFLYWALAVAFSERYARFHLLMQGGLSAVCITIMEHVFLGRSLAECARVVPRRMLVWYNIVLAAGLHADYWQSLWRARRLLHSDAQRHRDGAVWARVASCDAAELEALQKDSEELAGPAAAGPLGRLGLGGAGVLAAADQQPGPALRAGSSLSFYLSLSPPPLSPTTTPPTHGPNTHTRFLTCSRSQDRQPGPPHRLGRPTARMRERALAVRLGTRVLSRTCSDWHARMHAQN
jgi:hypothetical protein